MPKLTLTPYELSLIRQGISTLLKNETKGSLTYTDLCRLLDKVDRA